MAVRSHKMWGGNLTPHILTSPALPTYSLWAQTQTHATHAAIDATRHILPPWSHSPASYHTLSISHNMSCRPVGFTPRRRVCFYFHYCVVMNSHQFQDRCVCCAIKTRRCSEFLLYTNTLHFTSDEGGGCRYFIRGFHLLCEILFICW